MIILDVVGFASNPSSCEAEGRWISESEASLLYVVRSCLHRMLPRP